MTPYPPRPDRAAVFLRRGDHLLIMRRRKEGEVYDALPGGKVEPGETPEEAAVREVEEETGLRATVTGPVLTLPNAERTEFYFDAVAPDGEAVLGGPEAARNAPRNHYALEWVAIRDLPSRKIRPEALRVWMLARDWGTGG